MIHDTLAVCVSGMVFAVCFGRIGRLVQVQGQALSPPIMPVRALHKPRQRFRQWAVAMTALACSSISGAFSSPSRAENVDVAARRSSERLSFSDSEIAEGFFAVAFGAELQFGKRVERIRKFDEPVRVFVDNRTASGRSAEIGAAIADIRAHVQHLDIAITEDRNAANVIVRIVHERDFSRTLSARFGSEKARKISRSLKPVCLSGIGKDETFRIRHAEVFLPGFYARSFRHGRIRGPE
ncbi:MAG: DUF2927 domain-containing protein [Rhodomicrobium sp.]